MKKHAVCDTMAQSPLTLDRNDTLDKALGVMETNGIRHIPVSN